MLGLHEDASPTEIKRAYRRLAQQYHPDKNGGSREAQARFVQIVAAYRVLREAGRSQTTPGPRIPPHLISYPLPQPRRRYPWLRSAIRTIGMSFSVAAAIFVALVSYDTALRQNSVRPDRWEYLWQSLGLGILTFTIGASIIGIASRSARVLRRRRRRRSQDF